MTIYDHWLYRFLTGPLNNVAWLYILLPCVFAGGIYLTVGSGAVQFRRFGYAMKNTAGKLFKKHFCACCRTARHQPDRCQTASRGGLLLWGSGGERMNVKPIPNSLLGDEFYLYVPDESGWGTGPPPTPYSGYCSYGRSGHTGCTQRGGYQALHNPPA